MKNIAYFLPQFHETEENNEWWGEGFTEWTNVKSAKPLYKKHNQPKKPLKYYNLLNKETVEWQTNLSKENGIYGFCYYHYWFSGRKILEKPAENLLNWVDIPQKFMFCWANHSWKKTWNGTNELLIKQEYGHEDEWDEHITYLLNFFKDDRYIKKDNKPVFMLYSANTIDDLDKRIAYYNDRCIKEGFSGIYIIESMNNIKSTVSSDLSDAITVREPAVVLSAEPKLKKIQRYISSKYKKNYLYFVTKYKYEHLVTKSIDIAKLYTKKIDKKIYFSVFTGWDSTPRHVRRGYVVVKNDEENQLYRYIKDIQKLGLDDDYLFINAWNEWSEGMFLEPESDGKNGMLEEIRNSQYD